MAIALTPKLADLGIMAPNLGPWFSKTALELPLPADTMSVELSLGASVDWLAPASGLLSLFVTEQESPQALCSLQNASGEWPFAAGRLLAYFRLLPEVEARLHALMGLVPEPTVDPIGTTLPTQIGTPSRPQVRSFAMLLPASTALTADNVLALVGGPGSVPGTTDKERLHSLGLKLNGSTLLNEEQPMTRLRRPGGTPANRDRLLTDIPSETTLWAFDRRGRAIDPGAVACWWSWLLNTGVGKEPGGADSLQLIASDIPASEYPQSDNLPVVAPFAAGRRVHLVDAHEGVLAAPLLGGRLKDASGVVSDRVLSSSGTTAVELGFTTLPTPQTAPTTDNPQVDDAPRPRVAVLPAGEYGSTLRLWPGGDLHAGLTRDFARVAVVDEEFHLVGIARRDSRAGGTRGNVLTLEQKQSSQNRPSTRIEVSRTADTSQVLLANSAFVAERALAVPGGSAPTRWVMGVADVHAGTTRDATAPQSSQGPLPDSLTVVPGDTAPQPGEMSVRGLIGGGVATDRQMALLELNLGSANARCWMRAWPRAIDLRTGFRATLSGGAGRADAAGLVRAVIMLPNGHPDDANRPETLGIDLLLVLPDGSDGVFARRHYGDCRFNRPGEQSGRPASGVSGQWWICETGVSGSGALPRASLPASAHVVLVGDPPSLVDPTTLAATLWQSKVLQNRLQSSDVFMLTTPSFQSSVDRLDSAGRPLSRGAADVADVSGGLAAAMSGRLHRVVRDLASNVVASSQPHVLQDRLEVVVARVDTAATSATAVLGSVALSSWMQGGGSDFYLGQPGASASIETHGAGVALTGRPALALAEFARERTAGLTFPVVQGLPEPVRSAAVQSEIALAAEAGSTFPAISEGTGAGPVVAILRTCKSGLEGIPGACLGATQNARLWPFSQNEAELEAWLDTQVSVAGGAGSALRQAAGGRIDSLTRALDRRIQVGAFGAFEAFDCLLQAVARAQDFIYIETPALDDLPGSDAAFPTPLWTTLTQRMQARRGLHVIVCVPALLAARAPLRLQDARDQSLVDAISAINRSAPGRFAVFCPASGPGRSLRIASTSVVVDDAFALTGTTHLSRRGLTWDSSVAASVFDERLEDGRPREVRSFRVQLMADRLGISPSLVPLDADAAVQAIATFAAAGSERLSTRLIEPPLEPLTTEGLAVWHPDGRRTDLSVPEVVELFAQAAAITDEQHSLPDR